jgi:hypothetical protein
MSSSISLALAPIHGHPRIGGCEMKLRRVGNHRDVIVLGTGQFAHFIGHGHAADTGADNDNVGHDVSSCIGRQAGRAPDVVEIAAVGFRHLPQFPLAARQRKDGRTEGACIGSQLFGCIPRRVDRNENGQNRVLSAPKPRQHVTEQ